MNDASLRAARLFALALEGHQAGDPGHTPVDMLEHDACPICDPCADGLTRALDADEEAS